MGAGAALCRAARSDTLRARAREEFSCDVRRAGGQRAGMKWTPAHDLSIVQTPQVTSLLSSLWLKLAGWGFPGGLQDGQGRPAQGAPECAAAPSAGAMAGAHEAAQEGDVESAL